MTQDAPLLEVRRLSKRFGVVSALQSADLSVRPGEIHALIGANGAGKSTLVKILTGVHPPSAGSIALEGHERRFRSPAEARRAGVISVYQEPSSVPDLTILQNLRLTGTALPAMRPWLQKLEIADLDLSMYARDLPLPALRMLDLARALASEPNLLILDEITAALPADMSGLVFTVARRWREEGRAVIFISHRMAEVYALCDRATVLRDGLTVGVVELVPGAGEQIVPLMLGAAVEESGLGERAARTAAKDEARPAVEVRDLRAGRLQGVSFTLHAGEVLGVAALEGQGQQDLFDCLGGLRRTQGGEIVVGGHPRRFRHPHDAIQAGLVLVPSDRLQALLQQRSVQENVALPQVRMARSWGLINRRGERRRVDEVIRRLQIDIRAQSRVDRLSGGNQQKVSIARWLASGFATILCFDPTRGIDIGTKRQIYTLLRQLAEEGSAVLLFTSELPEIQLVCDRVLVLFEGRLVQEMPASAATEAALLRAAHGLRLEDAAERAG